MRNDRFLKACRREPVDRTPVWLMRQAGRYLKEYNQVRSRYSFLEMCKTPEIAAEVTLQPVHLLGVDAAILFADILLPIEPMGLELEFGQGGGPVIHNPVRSARDVKELRLFSPEEELSYVMETVRLVRRELDGLVPLIGFAGAPFTLASYIIEGGGSRTYRHSKGMMWEAPSVWHGLLEKIARVTLSYLKAQVRAGCQAVQLFDSWVGVLSPDDYRQFVLPYSKHVIEGLKDLGVPVIHFAQGACSLLELMGEAGGDVVGIDWRVNLDDAWRRLGYNVGIQGNLDPMVLFAPPAVIESKVKRILEQAGGRPGHIFNLGHGVHKDTPVDGVLALVDAVHKHGCKGGNVAS